MIKAEHNQILEDLWAQVNLNNFADDIILMSHLVSKEHQLQLMRKLIDVFPRKHQSYQGLKAQVGKAVADSQK